MSGDASKDIGQPGLRIDAIHFCCDDQAVHGCGAPSSTVGAAKQPSLSSEGDASQASFGSIVGEAHASVLEEQGEARPSFEDVIERLGQVMFMGESGELLPHVDLKFLDQRLAQRLSGYRRSSTVLH